MAAALLLASGASLASEQPAAPLAAVQPQSASWQPHRTVLGYFGITTVFTCDGLEGKVRQLLLYLGARPDLKVRASGCGPSEFPAGGAVSVSVEFNTLAATDDPAAPGAVKGYWAPLKLTPGQPRFVEAGDCELIEQLRRLLTDDFAWRDLDYRALCTPHDLSPDSFQMSGLLLKPSHSDAG